MLNTRRLGGGWLAAIAALLIFLPLQPANAADEKPKAQAAPAPAVLFATAQKRELTKQTEFVGRIEALEKVELRARVTGFLREQKFEAGAEVKKGDVLFSIEREPFEAVLSQREAQLAAAKATAENARVSLERYQRLESRQVASEAQLDERIADEKRSAASVLEAEAAVKDANINLSYATITAPISGRIGRSSVDPGNLVNPQSGVLATIVRTDKMYAIFSVTQSELLEAKKAGSDPTNLLVRARLADGSVLDERGKIDFIDVTVDPRTDGQQVRAVFPNEKSNLTDGQTVRLVIERENSDAVVSIPLAAIATDQTGQFVYLITQDDTVASRKVKLGNARSGFVEVKEGVKEGDRVIVQGQQKVRNGVKVKPEEQKASESSQDSTK